MDRRAKPDHRHQPAQARQSGVSVEREVEVSRTFEGTIDGAIEGIISDGPLPPIRERPAPAAPQLTDPGFTRSRKVRRVRTRIVVVTALVAAFTASLPWLSDVTRTRVALAPGLGLPREVDLEPALAALLVGMAALKTGVVLVAMGAVLWRVGRHGLSAGRRWGYELSLWTMAAGVGLVLGRVPHVGTALVGGALVFDAGVLAMLAVAASDDRLRYGRTPPRPA